MSDLKTLAQQFAFNAGMLQMLSKDMQPDDWAFRPEGGGNCALWILGHVCSARRMLVRKLGGDTPEVATDALFGMGEEPRDASELPDAATLLAEVQAPSKELVRVLEALTPEKAAEPWGHAFPDGSDTIAGGIRFLFFHESYHLGQLGLLRRMRGKQRFA